MKNTLYHTLKTNLQLFGNEYFNTFQEEHDNLEPQDIKKSILKALNDFQESNTHSGFYEFLGYLERHIQDGGFRNKYQEPVFLDDYDISIIMGVLMGSYVNILEQE